LLHTPITLTTFTIPLNSLNHSGNHAYGICQCSYSLPASQPGWSGGLTQASYIAHCINMFLRAAQHHKSTQFVSCFANVLQIAPDISLGAWVTVAHMLLTLECLHSKMQATTC
jgi:hypothetical protein